MYKKFIYVYIMNNLSTNLTDINNSVGNFTNSLLVNINKNKVLSSAIGILLVLYITMAAPKLPKSFLPIFDNSIFKVLYIFLIAYLASNNPALSLIIAVVLFVSFHTLSAYEDSAKLHKLSSNISTLR